MAELYLAFGRPDSAPVTCDYILKARWTSPLMDLAEIAMWRLCATAFMMARASIATWNCLLGNVSAPKS